MTIYKAFDPLVEVNGETILSFLDGMGPYKDLFTSSLKQNEIDDPEPGKWYLQQSWLNTFKEIAAKTGPATLKRIGGNIPENAKWPPGINTIEAALKSIDTAYHMNHRKGKIGNYAYTPTNDRSGIMVCDNPYPCQFDQGIIEATAKKFAARGEIVKVVHDASGPCRLNGGESCKYQISW